jgi:hypothetical protein
MPHLFQLMAAHGPGQDSFLRLRLITQTQQPSLQPSHPMDLSTLPDVVLSLIIQLLDPTSRLCMQQACRRMGPLVLAANELCISPSGSDACSVVKCLAMTQGRARMLWPSAPATRIPGDGTAWAEGSWPGVPDPCYAARMGEEPGGAAHHMAQPLRYDQTFPFTRGLGAYALTALLPNLLSLALDERSCCLVRSGEPPWIPKTTLSNVPLGC